MKICPECNRAAANGIPKCRNKKCGHVYTNNYGFKDEPTVRPDRKVQKPRKSRDPLIGPDDAPAISTMSRQ